MVGLLFCAVLKKKRKKMNQDTYNKAILINKEISNYTKLLSMFFHFNEALEITGIVSDGFLRLESKNHYYELTEEQKKQLGDDILHFCFKRINELNEEFANL